ncbi:MAG: antitoxin family protein, partial [Planctomycetes bacterium]|nr:antitoxin family protein [Planctomycetota bacterium]
YENGVFRPLEPVDIAEGTRVRFEVRIIAKDVDSALDAVYEVMDLRFNSGEHDVAERHNEHQP